MEKVTRREMIISGAAFVGATASGAGGRPAGGGGTVESGALPIEVGKVDMVAPDVYFHEGNLARGHCNNGWIVFEDYVLVIDANFPSGAQDVLPKIRAITDKPIRFTFDTHHHGDHAYGNQIWTENGATPLAHTGVIDEMKRYETGYYGGEPGRWEQAAKTRPDVKASHLKPPSLLFPRDLIFDDGKHRVELMHLGVAHTHGDAVAWLPRERILFTGDVCVNGPYNSVADGDTEKWIGTLAAAARLGARIVCPGHGQREGGTLLADQQAFFRELRESVGALVRAKKTPEQIRDAVNQLKEDLRTKAQISRYVTGFGVSFADQVEKVYNEMTGNHLPAAQKTALDSRRRHAHEHGLDIIA